LSIGRPTPNNTVYILDSQLQHVAVGVPGSMWAAGQGVTRGYVGLDSKTKENYVPDPFANDG
jgi:non-ribosomal peptide synthetase component F